MQMESVAEYLKQGLKISVLDNDYWPYLKKYDNERFAECVVWLKENYDNTYRFPLLADFKTAWHATHQTTDDPVERENINRAELSKNILALAEKFRVPGLTENKREKHRQRDLYRKKIKCGEIWSYRLKKWVQRTLKNNIGGNFLLPEDHLC